MKYCNCMVSRADLSASCVNYRTDDVSESGLKSNLRIALHAVADHGNRSRLLMVVKVIAAGFSSSLSQQRKPKVAGQRSPWVFFAEQADGCILRRSWYTPQPRHRAGGLRRTGITRLACGAGMARPTSSTLPGPPIGPSQVAKEMSTGCG